MKTAPAWRLFSTTLLLGFIAAGCDTSVDDDNDTDSDTDSIIEDGGTIGCGQEEGGVRVDLTVAGKERSFVLSTPNDYDPQTPYPLVFAWHGMGGSGSLARSYFGLKSNAHNEAIVVYPDALPIDAFGGATGWDLSESGYDLAYFDALYTHLTENLCVDDTRVFSTGHSFGGYMSNTLGCYRSESLNAIAPVAGGLGILGDCGDQLGVWVTHGTNDGTVPFSEGTTTRDHWWNHNECGDTTADVSNTCVTYDGCAREVQWCEHDGGHEWPSFAGEAIWEFFAAQ